MVRSFGFRFSGPGIQVAGFGFRVRIQGLIVGEGAHRSVAGLARLGRGARIGVRLLTRQERNHVRAAALQYGIAAVSLISQGKAPNSNGVEYFSQVA